MWYLYILKCADQSLYTGITNNLEKRMEAHRNGTGSKYVRAHLPFSIIYTEEHENKSEAAKREFEIKSWTKHDKISKLKLKL